MWYPDGIHREIPHFQCYELFSGILEFHHWYCYCLLCSWMQGIVCRPGKKVIYAVFKTASANQVIADFRFISQTFIGFIGGKIVDSIIIGFLCFLRNADFGFALCCAHQLNYRYNQSDPLFRTLFGCHTIRLAHTYGKSHTVCILYPVYLVLQQFDGNILGPKILGDSTGLSGFWVIFSITLFGGIFGVFGMLIGVPVFAVIYAYIKRLTKRLLKQKGLPAETSVYLDVGFHRGG